MKTYKEHINEALPPSKDPDYKLGAQAGALASKIEQLKDQCARLEKQLARRGHKASAASMRNVQGSLGKAIEMCNAADQDIGAD